MDFNLAVQECVLLGILAREPNVESRVRLEALLSQVRRQQIELKESA